MGEVDANVVSDQESFQIYRRFTFPGRPRLCEFPELVTPTEPLSNSQLGASHKPIRKWVWKFPPPKTMAIPQEREWSLRPSRKGLTNYKKRSFAKGNLIFNSTTLRICFFLSATWNGGKLQLTRLSKLKPNSFLPRRLLLLLLVPRQCFLALRLRCMTIKIIDKIVTQLPGAIRTGLHSTDCLRRDLSNQPPSSYVHPGGWITKPWDDDDWRPRKLI